MTEPMVKENVKPLHNPIVILTEELEEIQTVFYKCNPKQGLVLVLTGDQVLLPLYATKACAVLVGVFQSPIQ
jgi:hypothetical protein